MNDWFEKIRVLETGHNAATWNMALDEVLLDNLGDVPTLRIYGWSPPAVSIGYFQSMNEEVNVDECKRRGIDVIRRITGGGSVLHDSELTYSFLTKKYPQNIMESYELICGVIIAAINSLGFVSKFSPLNDITINGKKVSGNAQTRKKNTLLQHGTILLNVDIEKMFSVLKVPSEKIRDKMISEVKQRVTSLDKTFDEMANSLKKGFNEKFHATLAIDTLSDEEKIATEKLVREKYSTYQWNWKK
jgi:lipoate-protein ligase A